MNTFYSAINDLLKMILAPLVIIGAIAIAFLLVKNRKKPPPKQFVKPITQVEVTTLKPSSVIPKITTFGNTSSYLETQLSSQVAGEILEISQSFDVGKQVQKGDWLVRINSADFEAALAERQSALEAAKRTLTEEQTRSKLARDDWQASGRSLENAPEFTLRIPQMNAAQAAVQSATAAVLKAELDIDRTTIRAPFDSIVTERQASPGEVIATGTILGNLIANEKAEVSLPLTPEQAVLVNLKRIKTEPISLNLSSAALPNFTWQATIQRINPIVDTQTRTVQVIAEINKPFDQQSGKMLPIGAFMNAEIKGERLENVYQLKESSVVEDSYIWCVNNNNKLVQQPIDLVARQSGSLIIRITKPVANKPFKMVTRPLASFSQGLEVKIRNNTTPSAADGE